MLTKTGAAPTADHFGARKVVRRDIKLNITKVCATFLEADKYVHGISICQDTTRTLKNHGRAEQHVVTTQLRTTPIL